VLARIEQVVAESMRLYPPAWIIGRRAIGEYQLGDYMVPARTLLFMSPYVMQRDGRYYADADRFLPDRWTPAFKASLPKFAYFPFGGGPRQCIGEGFAWTELLLVLATIAQRWRLRLVPGQRVATQPLVTLRAKHGIEMIATERSDSTRGGP
jgi:cytochrome P450